MNIALDKITTDPDRYQFRDAPFCDDTVAAIVREGLDPAKFDPLPVVKQGSTYVVGGDGHSRLEALRRIAAGDGTGLPPSWVYDGQIAVPVRLIGQDDALRMAYAANMSRSPFTPCEEAKIFQARLDAGESIDEVAESSHKSTTYVRKRLTLQVLCKTVRAAVGKPWGIDTTRAIIFAEKCAQHAIDHAAQQRLWVEVISQQQWTEAALAAFLDRVAGPLMQKSNDDFLFEMPVNLGAVMADIAEASRLRRLAVRGIQCLQVANSVLDPVLAEMIAACGDEMLAQLRASEDADAGVLAALCTTNNAQGSRR